MSDRLIVAANVDGDLDAAVRPKSLAIFIGKRKGRENLSAFLSPRRAVQAVLAHFLLAGPPGTG